MSLFRRTREFADLEARLREERPKPPADLVARLEEKAAPVARRPHRSWGRYGLAAGFAASVVVATAALGGSALVSGSTASETIVVTVPTEAVPVVRRLQAMGGIIAAEPVTLKKGSIIVQGAKGVVVQPQDPDITAAVKPPQDSDSNTKVVNLEPVRTVGPALASRTTVTRLPATVVYIPGTFVLICYPIAPSIYQTWLVPYATALALIPPATWGPCPGWTPP